MMRSLVKMMSRSDGFTLIELLVVIVIVGILTGVAVPTFLNQVKRARVAEANYGLALVSRGSEIYRLYVGFYPNDYSEIEPSPGNPDYMDQAFNAVAPNYEPVPEVVGAGGGRPDGIAWRARAIAGNPSYTNYQGDPITCVLGIGVDSSLTDLDSNCNL